MGEQRIGLVVEGTTEERVLAPLLRRHVVAIDPKTPASRVIGRTIVDGGNKVRQKEWVKVQVEKLRKGKHSHVLVVADQEKHVSAEVIRKRLESCGADGVYVATPYFERWLLCDRSAVEKTFGVGRPDSWRSRLPLEVLQGLKQGYKKTTDGSLLGRASSAAAWASQEREFCSLLRHVETILELPKTDCRM